MDTQDPPPTPLSAYSGSNRFRQRKRCYDVRLSRQEGSMRRHLGRPFLAFSGPVCADQISNCPLDRVLTYKNLIYLLNLQFCDLPQGNKLGSQVGKGKHQRTDISICIIVIDPCLSLMKSLHSLKIQMWLYHHERINAFYSEIPLPFPNSSFLLRYSSLPCGLNANSGGHDSSQRPRKMDVWIWPSPWFSMY